MRGAQRGYPWSPCSSLALSSGALSLKDTVWRGNPSLISEQYKFFNSDTVASLSFDSFFCPNTRGITASFGLQRAWYILFQIQIRNASLPCSRSSCLACNLICTFCTLSVHPFYRKHLWLLYLQHFSKLQVSFATLAV